MLTSRQAKYVLRVRELETVTKKDEHKRLEDRG